MRTPLLEKCFNLQRLHTMLSGSDHLDNQGWRLEKIITLEVFENHLTEEHIFNKFQTNLKNNEDDFYD